MQSLNLNEMKTWKWKKMLISTTVSEKNWIESSVVLKEM